MDGNSAPTDARQTRIVELLRRLAPAQGITASALDEVRFMRANCAFARGPVFYEPKIVVVCQGRKRGYLGEESFDFGVGRYLVLAVPLPFEAETEACEAEPLLAVGIDINLASAAELILALDGLGGRFAVAPRGIVAAPVDEAFADALLRLLQVLSSPVEARLLGPGIVRELLFRVLTGEQGAAIAGALMQHSHCGRIGRALRRIHAEYAGDLDVGQLAAEAGMSAAAFHSHFKAVTKTSPMQYLKTTRLHKARLLMVQEGVGAATASARVGYESASQFSREFKRFFGATPREESERLKSVLVMSEAASPYVSVQ